VLVDGPVSRRNASPCRSGAVERLDSTGSRRDVGDRAVGAMAITFELRCRGDHAGPQRVPVQKSRKGPETTIDSLQPQRRPGRREQLHNESDRASKPWLQERHRKRRTGPSEARSAGEASWRAGEQEQLTMRRGGDKKRQE